MKKTTKKYIIQGLKVALIAVFGVLFIAILIKARLQAGESVCNEIQVNVKNADKFQFIAENEIIDFINNNGKDVVINQRLKDVDYKRITESQSRARDREAQPHSLALPELVLSVCLVQGEGLGPSQVRSRSPRTTRILV